MLSPRNKIIILIAGSLILFILLIGTIFGWFRKTTTAPGSEAVKPDLSFLQSKPTVENKVFDASNPDDLKAYDPRTAGAGENISPAEKAARAMAIFFVERFGTYSSDAGSAYVDDLQAFMTSAMQAWTKTYLKSGPKRDGYYAITAEIAALDTALFSAAKQQAKFALVVNRSETIGGKINKYQQKADVELVQTAGGDWKVNSLYWGDKL